MDRAFRYLRRHGFRRLLVRLYQKFWPIQRSYVYTIETPSGFEGNEALQIERYGTYQDMSEALWEQLARQGQQHLRDSVQKLFRTGSELWLGFLPEGRLAGVCWSRRGRAKDNYFVPIGPNEATIFSCWVLEPFRGRGIYPSMLKEIVNRSLQSGVSRIYIDCKKWNHPSVRGIEKTGFNRLGSAWRLKIRAHSFVFAESWKPPTDSRRTPYGRRGLGLRCVYLAGAVAWWIGTGFGRLGKRGAVVLCYHAVLPSQARAFRRQMRSIQKRVVRSDRLPRGGVRFGSPLSVCVTFDDAFVCLRDHALPALREYGIESTVFVPVENLDSPPRWSMPADHPESRERVCCESELRGLAGEQCITIGSHSCTHPDMTRIDAGEVGTELRESKKKLEALLGREIRDFAFPHGRYTATIAKQAAEAGYARVCTLDPQVVRRGEGVLGRFLVSPDMWEIEFKLTAAGAYQWLYLLRKCAHSLGLK